MTSEAPLNTRVFWIEVLLLLSFSVRVKIKQLDYCIFAICLIIAREHCHRKLALTPYISITHFFKMFLPAKAQRVSSKEVFLDTNSYLMLLKQ